MQVHFAILMDSNDFLIGLDRLRFVAYGMLAVIKSSNDGMNQR